VNRGGKINLRGYSPFLSTILLITITLSIYALITLYASPSIHYQLRGLANIYDNLAYANNVDLSIIYHLNNGDGHYLYFLNYGSQPLTVTGIIVNHDLIESYKIIDLETGSYTNIIFPQKLYLLNITYSSEIHDIYILSSSGLKIPLEVSI